MCVVTTTSVWVAVAPIRFFILWNRLKPRGTDSTVLFICGIFCKILNCNSMEVVDFLLLFTDTNYSSFLSVEKFKERVILRPDDLYSVFKNNIQQANHSMGRDRHHFLMNSSCSLADSFSSYHPSLPVPHLILLMLFFFLSS